jgi:hypothetical protein
MSERDCVPILHRPLPSAASDLLLRYGAYAVRSPAGKFFTLEAQLPMRHIPAELRRTCETGL